MFLRCLRVQLAVVMLQLQPVNTDLEPVSILKQLIYYQPYDE